jgi:putative ABC transport system ATP-binding protein
LEGDAIAASCTGVVKIYWAATGEVHALKGIDAIFPCGAVTAIVGPSGSGKSSLLRILAGMDKATAGSVVVGDTELGGLSPSELHRLRRRLVGYVFQRPSDNLMPHMTVGEHLATAASRRSYTGAAEELLDQLGVGHRRGHKPSELSGGEQQRVAFAQALMRNPAVVIADEPTAELDTKSARSLLGAVRDLADTGASFVVSTHDPKVVDAADATLYLRHGAMEAESINARSLSVIDSTGRIQLPPEALRLFPGRRALLHLEDEQIRITPP